MSLLNEKFDVTDGKGNEYQAIITDIYCEREKPGLSPYLEISFEVLDEKLGNDVLSEIEDQLIEIVIAYQEERLSPKKSITVSDTSEIPEFIHYERIFFYGTLNHVKTHNQLYAKLDELKHLLKTRDSNLVIMYHETPRPLGLTPKQLKARIKDYGLNVKSHCDYMFEVKL